MSLRQAAEAALETISVLYGSDDELAQQLRAALAEPDAVQENIDQIVQSFNKTVCEERDELKRENRRLNAAVQEAAEACRAYSDLATCYRIGKHPTEELWKRLDKARDWLSRHAREGSNP